ncbi:phage tail protein [Pseudodesulfovibrio sp.]|uniref:phage tail-collar fiber domain-containing protein n=1 Tax=unclassified Pseudodesulfovibrio TaxID=2661612 RepID=UPI003AFF6762
MSSAITNAGEALIALKQNQEAPLVIDRFLLANVAGVDPAAAVDRTEGKPDAGDIVHEYTIPAEGKGYINPNQVVYSMLLTSDIGDFDFNWIGLYSSADDVVVAIAYLPTLSKWKTAHPTMGNALTRNFMLEYSGLQATTQITVEASTWQLDFTARLKGIDERERLSNFDIYGGACFFDDGFLIVDDAGTFKLQPGLGYVEGIRIEQLAEQILAPALPADVYLDVALQPQGSDRVAVSKVVYADPGDYVDGTNDKHFGQKIAEIAADRAITDTRPKTMAGAMADIVALKDHTHTGYAVTDHEHTVADVTDLLNAAHKWTAPQYPEVTPLEWAATLAWDMSAIQHAQVTLADATVLANPTDPIPSACVSLRIVQDGAGSRVLSYGSDWLPVGRAVPDLSTDAGAVDLLIGLVNPAGKIEFVVLNNFGAAA